MRTRALKSTCLLLTICAALWAASPPACGQALLGLSAQMYAGLNITGAVGTACEIQYVTDLAHTNNWLHLTNLTLASNPQLWVDTTSPATERRFYRVAAQETNVVATNMAIVAAGSFTMGDALDGWDVPVHSVYISAFLMDKYLVTKALWEDVRAWSGGNSYSYEGMALGKAGNHPVVAVNWYDAVKWCNARSEKEGLTPCYYTDGNLTVVYKTGAGWQPYVNWSANGYRLPTEAEWEKAARGGLSGHRFPWGDNITHSQANYYSTTNYAFDVSPTRGFHPTYSDAKPYTSPVGSFAANGYGLCDMAGNVFEWCWDWFNSTWYEQPGATQNDTHGPADPDMLERVLRGGAWFTDAYGPRSAARIASGPSNADIGTGFRCVRRP